MHKVKMLLIPLIVASLVTACSRPPTEEEVASQLLSAHQELSYYNFANAYGLYTQVLPWLQPGSADWQAATYGRSVSAQNMTPASAANLTLAELGFTQLLFAESSVSELNDESVEAAARWLTALDNEQSEWEKYQPGREEIRAVVNTSQDATDDATAVDEANLAKARRLLDLYQNLMAGSAAAEADQYPGNAPQKVTQENLQDAELAFLLYQKTLPHTDFASSVMISLGAIDQHQDYADDAVNLPMARRWYAKVVQLNPQSQPADEATLRTAMTYIQTFDEANVQRGLDLMMAWLKDRPHNPLASVMWEFAGDTHFQFGQHREALDCYIHADELGLASVATVGKTYWKMAVIAHDFLHDQPMAIKYYTKVITDGPTSGRAWEAQQKLLQMGITPPEIEMNRFYSSHQPGSSPGSSPNEKQKSTQPAETAEVGR